METLWNVKKTDKFNSLGFPIECDVAIVGGGLTSLLSAYFLKDSQLNISLFTDKNFTQSASARSNAKITTVNTTLYSDIAKNFNNYYAKYFYDDKKNAVESYIKIIKDHNIECELEKISSFLYATTEQGKLKIQNEIYFFNDENIYYVEHSEILENIITSKLAYEFKNEYSFNPVMFMEALINIMKTYDNITFYENSCVTNINKNSLISNNQKVNFKKCIAGTHFPTFKIFGHYAFKISQEKATLVTFNTSSPLKNMYVSIDNNNLSYRPLNNDTMILVGNNHRTGEQSNQYIEIEKIAQEKFKNVTNVKTYSNQDCVTFDGLPYIDTASILLPNVYIATGYNLFGITSSMMSAKHISNTILNNIAIPKIYSRNRFNLKAQKAEFKKHIKTIIYEFTHKTNKNDNFSKKTILNLQEGEGFTFIHKNRHIGVSMFNGKLIFVNNKCTHLGCPLHYNSESKTWDCRCHGSSYKQNGEFIFSPSNQNLEIINYFDFEEMTKLKE